MSVKHALLGILSRQPRHGYELKREFDDALGDFWSLNFGQIYTTLERLQADGLVEHQEVSQHDKPDKKVYRITDQGLAEFYDWKTRAIKPEPRSLRDEPIDHHKANRLFRQIVRRLHSGRRYKREISLAVLAKASGHVLRVTPLRHVVQARPQHPIASRL